MYDDHTEMAPPGARALILAPDVDAGTATVEWQHSRGPGTVFAMGSFRVSSDGTAVIGWGNTPSCGFSEVDVNGNDMLDFTFPDHSETDVYKRQTSP